ncbi:hypothetical protein PsorP6_008635 [Peronosclerospora sorghi]|uniref:Uncharacterized protein n=1 Tax=Peronosclerospora sorghi TaxID=230839 RepID=A0ACC0WBM5_9STRA|nr:hypothetical protein PsorP6_008635 [Peronosclerospora sorghi]
MVLTYVFTPDPTDQEDPALLKNEKSERKAARPKFKISRRNNVEKKCYREDTFLLLTFHRNKQLLQEHVKRHLPEQKMHSKIIIFFRCNLANVELDPGVEGREVGRGDFAVVKLFKEREGWINPQIGKSLWCWRISVVMAVIVLG